MVFAGSRITSQIGNLGKIIITFSLSIRLKFTERVRTLVFFASFLDLKVETLTCGTSYKFALLKKCIIRSSWEIGHNDFLEKPMLIRLVSLERGLRGLSQFAISDLGDPKF